MKDSAEANVVLPEQIKARNFEIPGCGGFQVSGPAENLHEYFEPDREIVVYSSVEDLVHKIRYYMAHESERAAIAQAGYERAQRDHTYEKRFRDIFERIGLKSS